MKRILILSMVLAFVLPAAYAAAWEKTGEPGYRDRIEFPPHLSGFQTQQTDEWISGIVLGIFTSDDGFCVAILDSDVALFTQSAFRVGIITQSYLLQVPLRVHVVSPESFDAISLQY